MSRWQKFLQEARDNRQVSNEPYQRQVRKGHVKNRDTYLKGGPIATDAGGSGYKKKPPNSRSLSAPPLGEEVDPETFEKKAELEPKFWVAGRLNPKISRRLLKIAQEFIDGLDLPVPIEIEDITLTGSLANYNWSKYSDVDLHIVVNFSKIDFNRRLVKKLFDEARMRWNELHDIMMYGHEVEIYVEDTTEVHKSSGIYSIAKDDWIVEPVSGTVHFDYPTARKKADAIEAEVNLITKFANDKPRATLKSVERLKEKIRRIRRAGLNSPEQEYSAENIAFKILRREHTLDKLNDMKYDAYDRILSVVE